eukprot:13022384-Alexandrium_andersonii.AAC.1
MSASLVGSEMCIRDRRPALRPHSESAPRRCRQRRGGCEWHRRACRAPSVSYTHLTLPTICSV